ncbi:MAG TPA: ATP-binding protein [Vicinamibacterales bacterium]|nr:ATP-binding protein [Vicinamibacterales bacterium]
MQPRLTSMTAGLAIGITAAVAVACAAGAYFYSKHHFDTLLQNERATALAQGELMRAALEHQMIENDRSLIAQLVQTFGREARVRNVLLLDREGHVRYASHPESTKPGNELRLDSPTCQACHRLPPAQRESSRIVETSGGTMLRTVIPFRNRAACYGCHDPARKINGIMILDFDAGEMRAAMNRDLRWMVAGSGALSLVLIAAIALIVRLVVLRRLQRFETTARQIASGNLDRRVPAGGSDTISWLANEFNTMADSMTGLVSEVRHQRERVETVINSIDDGIVVLDTHRRVVAANDAFLRRTGHVRQQVLGCSCRDVAAGVCTAADCPTLACLQSGERQVRICERRSSDGTARWEEVHASPIRDPSGALVQVVEVWRDISERRTAEARLAESHRLASLGVLASGFSHELNTPLGTVLMCVEGILRDVQDGGGGDDWRRIGESARIARDQILRCRGITQHFLRMSRGQSGTADLIELQPALAVVARLIEPTARAQGVVIETLPVPPGIHVKADEAELQHALMNLVLNAVQACSAGGRVTIGLDGANPLRLRVSDNGCGVPPEHQKRIFEPFFSLRKGGTGLGLFLALNFVRRWGGDIAVTSVPGEGSTFDVLFPAASAAGYRSAS